PLPRRLPLDLGAMDLRSTLPDQAANRVVVGQVATVGAGEIALGLGQPAGAQQSFRAGTGVDPFLRLPPELAADFLGLARFLDPTLKLRPATDQRLVGDIGPPPARLAIPAQGDQAVAGESLQGHLEMDRIVARAELCDRLLTPRVGPALT